MALVELCHDRSDANKFFCLFQAFNVRGCVWRKPCYRRRLCLQVCVEAAMAAGMRAGVYDSGGGGKYGARSKTQYSTDSLLQAWQIKHASSVALSWASG